MSLAGYIIQKNPEYSATYGSLQDILMSILFFGMTLIVLDVFSVSAFHRLKRRFKGSEDNSGPAVTGHADVFDDTLDEVAQLRKQNSDINWESNQFAFLHMSEGRLDIDGGALPDASERSSLGFDDEIATDIVALNEKDTPVFSHQQSRPSHRPRMHTTNRIGSLISVAVGTDESSDDIDSDSSSGDVEIHE